MNTLENNKLIAKFLGAKVVGNPMLNEYEMYGIIECIEDGENEQHCFIPQEMKFHSSWDWLMPVVEKIELTYMYSVTICWEHCIIDKAGENKEGFPRIELDSSHKILATYNAVVEFIKWYNENNL